MARDIQKHLKQLRDRRRGLDRVTTLSMDAVAEVLAKSDITESYQTRSNQPNTQYALGAMQEVGPTYTQIGLDEATRVGKQLAAGLEKHGILVAFELQGSVPLNVHIRGVSDVDLLTLHGEFVTHDPGFRQNAGVYTSAPYTALDKMRELRTKSETVLVEAYPKAIVNCAGAKAIKISGGSLRRAVDVVPSHWHDTTEWQTTQQKHDRGVKVYNKSDHKTFLNMPFLHIKMINERDNATLRGLKKTIRLCKNIKGDAEADGKSVAISSYEIASLMWHCEPANLIVTPTNELALLAATQKHLDYLSRNVTSTMELMTPDKSRRIIDSVDKFNGLIALSLEIDDLAAEVTKEHKKIPAHGQLDFNTIQKTLGSSYVIG